MSVKLLTEYHLEFLSLKGGCTSSSETTLVKMPHCWKSHVAAQTVLILRKGAHKIYKYDFAAKCCKNDARQKQPLLALYKPTFYFTLFGLTVSAISFHHFCIICWLSALTLSIFENSVSRILFIYCFYIHI